MCELLELDKIIPLLVYACTCSFEVFLIILRAFVFTVFFCHSVRVCDAPNVFARALVL